MFPRWVLDLLADPALARPEAGVGSVQADLVPFLVRLCVRGARGLPPALRGVVAAEQALALSMSAAGAPAEGCVSVYAVTLPAAGPYCARCTDVNGYREMTLELMTRGAGVWPKLVGACVRAPVPAHGALVGAMRPPPPRPRARVPMTGNTYIAGARPTGRHFIDCLVGERCELTAKDLVLKRCVLGPGCTVGEGSKLNSCVVMDRVEIGDRYAQPRPRARM